MDELVAVVPPGDEPRAAAALAGLGAGRAWWRAARSAPTRSGTASRRSTAARWCWSTTRPGPSPRPELVRRVAEAAARDGAALAAQPVTDTVKRAAGERSEGQPRVAATLDRRELWLAQTPQGFRRELLLRAYAAAGPTPRRRPTSARWWSGSARR